MDHLSRRSFVKNTLAAGTSFALADKPNHSRPPDQIQLAPQSEKFLVKRTLDLSPASWIWLPSERCLSNTVIFFRKTFHCSSKPQRATGWILGDSRYKLYVNGQRIQFGPAPSDPRWPEADPINIGDYINVGENVIAAEVLYYGHGEGTWPIGKPGFIFKLDIELDNQIVQLVSDASWQCKVARSWQPGQYKRWYLRALQEQFDARQYPFGWNTIRDAKNDQWYAPMMLKGPADKPVISAQYRDYLYDSQGNPNQAELRERSISMPKETFVPVLKLTESFYIQWKSAPEEYFEFVMSNAFDLTHESLRLPVSSEEWIVNIKDGHAAVLTFEFPEQIVGFPMFTIEASEGTVIELLVHEAHQPGTDILINSHFHAWTRFICKEGLNEFETFDYESLRWLQLHIRNSRGSVKVSNVGVRRRMFDFRNKPKVRCNDPMIQKVIDASLNTLYNCAIETIVDGMGRERQQYSGDVGHVLHAIFYSMGEPSIASRFLNTYSQGITKAGYFLDCWPAFDRLARLMERELDLTEWGPLLDHGVGFNFDVYHYYLYTADIQNIREVFPRLTRFFNFLLSLIREDGLLPVDNIGIPVVWIDHIAYKKQRHKQCAFNLYVAAMMQHALAPLCRAFDEPDMASIADQAGRKILQATVKKFWSDEKKTFVINLPWIDEENDHRMCDRSLSTALLFDQCPGGHTETSLRLLIDQPDNIGMSYPANTGWRYWALSKFGRADIFIKEVREKWGKMDSVKLNNTLAEDWHARPDSHSQWSHCPIAPLYGMHMCVAGINPLKPGFNKVEIAPQLGDLDNIDITSYTVKGPIVVNISRHKRKTEAKVDIPNQVEATLKWKDKSYVLREGRNTITLA
jgi:alpha-L-rhamnosidase